MRSLQIRVFQFGSLMGVFRLTPSFHLRSRLSRRGVCQGGIAVRSGRRKVVVVEKAHVKARFRGYHVAVVGVGAVGMVSYLPILQYAIVVVFFDAWKGILLRVSFSTSNRFVAGSVTIRSRTSVAA